MFLIICHDFNFFTENNDGDLYWATISSRQAVIRQPSGSCQAVVRQSSGSRQAVVRQSSGSRQAVVKQLSGGCLILEESKSPR